MTSRTDARQGTGTVSSATTLARRKNISAWAKKGSFAVLDQGFFAAANFSINILLARCLDPTQYGAFALAYSVFLILLTLHSAILIEPMLIFGSGKYSDKFRSYIGILTYTHWILSLIFSLCFLVATLVCWHLGARELVQASAGLALSLPCLLWLGFMRRVCYVRSEPQWAAIGGGCYLMLILGGGSWLYTEQQLSVFLALLLMGGASGIVSVCFLSLVRPQWRLAGSSPAIGMVLHDHWQYGRWSSATTTLTWLPGNLYYTLLPVWAGLEGSAALRAIMNLATPLLQVMSAGSVLFLPKFTRMLRSDEKGSMHHLVQFATFLFVAGAVINWFLLFLFGNKFFSWLYADRYAQYADLLVLVGFFPLLEGISGVLSTALRAMLYIDRVFWCSVVGVLLAFTAGLGLIAYAGVVGAVTGLIMTWLGIAAALAWCYIGASADQPDGLGQGISL